MARRFRCGILCFAATISLGTNHLQAQSGSISPSARANGSVEGRVSNALTGDLIPGATIRLIPVRYARNSGSAGETQNQTRSQADGSFHLDAVAPGEYILSAEADGFVSNQVDRNSRFLDVVAGQATTDVNVPLTPAGSIAGSIEDDDGHKIGGVRVEALSPVTTRGRTNLKQGVITTTDQAGHFLLPNLAPAEYYVVAHPNIKEQKPETAKEGELVRTVYPHALDFNSASALQLSAGQSMTDLNLSLRRTSTFHIRGTVSEPPPGTQVEKPTVVLVPTGATDVVSLSRSVQPAADRSFDIGHVVPGSYALRLTGSIISAGGNTGRRHMLLARQDVEVGGSDLNGIALTITPPLTLAGHVTLVGSSSGSPSGFNRVHVVAKLLEDVTHASQASANVNADGTFSLTRLDPGLYVINTAVNIPGVYLKSVLLNQQDVTNKEIDLSGISAAQIEVILSSGAGEIDGTIQSDGGAPPAGSSFIAAVVLVPEQVGPDGSGVLFGYSRGDGSFAIPNVAPGKYSAYAVSRADPNLWQNPDFLREMQAAATAVELQENGRQQLQLRISSPVQIAEAAGRLGLTVQ